MGMDTAEMIRRAQSTTGKRVRYLSGPSSREVECSIVNGEPQFFVDWGFRRKQIAREKMDALLAANLQKSLERAAQYSHIKGEKIVLSDVPCPQPGQVVTTEDMIQRALMHPDQECFVSIQGRRYIRCQLKSTRDGTIKTPCFTFYPAFGKRGRKMIRAVAEGELGLAGDKARFTK